MDVVEFGFMVRRIWVKLVFAGIRKSIWAVSSMVETRIYTGRSPWFEDASGPTNQNSLSICENKEPVNNKKTKKENIFFTGTV